MERVSLMVCVEDSLGLGRRGVIGFDLGRRGLGGGSVGWLADYEVVVMGLLHIN